jgi:transposase InsO family protein
LPQRRLEQYIRGEAATLAEQWRALRVPLTEAAQVLLAVRDLASGQQLAWRPVDDETEAPVLAELRLLFAILVAQLVLKSDNGSAFRARRFKALLRPWQVWPLYSPPGRPEYNGAIEASIGWSKKRTQFLAEQRGPGAGWTSADLETARELANSTTWPKGWRRPTPQQAWEARRILTQGEREEFAARVKQLEEGARRSAGLVQGEGLEHDEQAALHRRVLEEALVESGLLFIKRRRIPQRFLSL